MSGPNFFIGNNSWFTFYDSESQPLPSRRCDGSPLKPSDTLLDIRSGTIRQYRVDSPPGFTGWQAAGVLGDSNGDAVNFGEEVEFAVIDQRETATAYPSYSWKCLSGGNVITKFSVTMNNNQLLFKQGDVTGPTIMTFQANGNVLFANNVTVTGDLFADDVAYDETLVNILRVEDRIEHNGNATNKITFETDKMTIDASGTSIVLDDAAMTDKIVVTGQTKFVNNIDDVPNIYLQNHIHHSGDINTRIGFPANDQIALRTGGTDRLLVSDTQTTSSNNIVVSSTGGIILNPGSNAASAVVERSGIITNNVQGFSPYTSNIAGASGGGCQISMNNTSIVCSTFPSTTNVGDPVTLTERMRLNATGLGINTNNPSYKLHVEGSGTANEVVGWFNNQGSYSSSIAVRQSSKTAYVTNHNGLGTPNYDDQLSNAISFGVSSGSSPIQFYNGNTGVAGRGTAKLTILEGGNVGIGAATFVSNERLRVAGNVGANSCAFAVTATNPGVTCASGIATTVFAFTPQARIIYYEVFVRPDTGTDPTNYAAMTTIAVSNGGARQMSVINGGLLTLTLSGNNLQVTQSSGISQSIITSVRQIFATSGF